MRPRDVKFNKVHRGVYIYGCNEMKCVDLNVGIVGLKSTAGGRVGNKEMETVKKVMRRIVKKKGKVFLKFFPDKGLTKKAVAVRMGKGKGNVSKWVGEVRKGKIMYELTGITVLEGRRILEGYGKVRLPVESCIVEYRI
jgi:large subunit ribosomal protein L16